MRHESASIKAKNRAVRWSLLVAASGALLFVVGVSTVRETMQGRKVDEEINGLEAQVATLEGQKLQLAGLVERLNTPEALDKEARARLGLRKPGERVVIVRDMDATQGSWNGTLADGNQSSTTSSSRAMASNPHKWLQYFLSRSF